MNHEARSPFKTVEATLARKSQRDSFRTLIAGFLDATGRSRPEYATTKSPAALSRFLNEYDWDALSLIRVARQAVLERLWTTYALRRGRRPILELILDLSTLGYTYDAERSGQNAHRSGAGQPVVSPRSGGGQGGENGDSPNSTVGLPDSEGSTDENARLRGINFSVSYAPSEG